MFCKMAEKCYRVVKIIRKLLSYNMIVMVYHIGLIQTL